MSKAIHEGNIEEIELILSRKPDAVHELVGEPLALPPLVIASAYGNENVVKYLLEKGADVNTADPVDNISALLVASERGDLDLVQLLVRNGANVSLPDKNGITPLHNAVSKGYVDLTLFLLENGADIEAPSRGGVTPLIWAALFCQPEVVKILIDHGARVGAITSKGKTTLDLLNVKKCKNQQGKIKIINLLRQQMEN